MLTFSTLIVLLQSILFYGILFFLGKALNNSQQLRSFLSLKSKDENPQDFNETTDSVEKIGGIIMIIAAVGALYSLITAIIYFS